MTKYIERDKAVKLIFLAADTGRAANALSLLGKESVADVVEVVRCKDCKYRSMESGDFDGLEPACRFWTDAGAIYPVFVDMNGFCSEGELKDGGESND